MTPIPNSQLLAALNWRYATKAFDPGRQIPADTWTTLVQALVLSPSSFGLQPYRFLVVNDPALRKELQPHAWGQRQVVDASHFVVFAARTGMTEAEIDAFLGRVAQARAVTVESLTGYRGMMTGMLLSESFKPQLPHWAALQAYIALGNLMTSAAVLGVDACPIEGFVPAEFDRILGLPARGLAAVVCCALGYRSAADPHATLPKVRLDSRELVRAM